MRELLVIEKRIKKCQVGNGLEVKKIKILTLRINMANLDYEKLIGEWHRDRNLFDGSTDKDQ